MEAKWIALYFGVLIVLVIATLLLTNFLGGGQAKITTLSTSTSVTLSSTIFGGNITTSYQPTTSIRYSKCISTNATENITNGDFSTGNYTGWNVSGGGFNTAPLNLTLANSQEDYYGNSGWKNYNGTYAATTFQRGLLLAPGNITSTPFNVTELFLNFQIISSQEALLYVEILKNNTPEIVTHYNTYAAANVPDPETIFLNASIPLGTLLCQRVSVRVVGGSSGMSRNGNGYIAVGNFYLAQQPRATKGIIVNQSINPT